MGYSKDITGSPLFCEGQAVVARNKPKSLMQTIYRFPTMYGKPIYAIWVDDCVQVQTDKNRAYLVINNSTIKQIG